MAKERIIEALNKDLVEELTATIEYLWQEFLAEGMEPAEVAGKFEETAIAEMKHIEKLAKRIVCLGGMPDHRVGEIEVSKDLRAMIEHDLKMEQKAIAQYKEHIKIAAEEDDPVTRCMLEEILGDEEDHADGWQTLLGAK